MSLLAFAPLKEMRAIHASLCAEFGFSSLLAKPESNPKVAKNMKAGILTSPLHLAPARLSGFEVCAMRTPGCTAACLHTAGNPAHMAGKSRARVNRTTAYFKAREQFMIALTLEIWTLARKAESKNMLCGVRLNATSDIPWESVPVLLPDGTVAASLMALFPDVSFYDYTKRPNRKGIPPNYHLTFSLAENNEHHGVDAFQAGFNLACVFAVKRGAPLPASYDLDGVEIPVIDGDESDYRPNDPTGVIVGLRAKGRAIGDRSGFVRSVA
jgi:hypothetical protein